MAADQKLRWAARLARRRARAARPAPKPKKARPKRAPRELMPANAEEILEALYGPYGEPKS